ncbi:MAG: hypothetical protein LBK03_08210 [Bacteroidales bacterium]|nr:hypothetical protein [Bacteroidales bacterium]
METIRKIRLALSKGMGVREASRTFNKSRKTIRKIIQTEAMSFSYHREKEHYPALEGYREALETLLKAESALTASKRRTILSLYEELQGKGYEGSYSAVRRYARKWQGNQAPLSEVYIPLTFGKGEAFQFDWSSEEVEISGEVIRVGVAHFRLCYSRMSFIIAYPLQKMEMLLDAHVQSILFLKNSLPAVALTLPQVLFLAFLLPPISQGQRYQKPYTLGDCPCPPNRKKQEPSFLQQFSFAPL